MMKASTKRALRGGARALTGVAIIGAAAAAALVLGTTPLPSIERAPIAIDVAVGAAVETQLVCAGSFAELGADPSRPSVSVPTGVALLSVAGSAASQTELTRGEPGGSAPAVLTAPGSQHFAAAQTQTLDSESLRGRTASACTEPVNEQWLLGGMSIVGVTTTLHLGNPFNVPATVTLSVFDEQGQVDSSLTTGVLVPAGTERIVSLNGYAPARERLAVRVESTGAAVTASLGVNHASGLIPFAVDTVTRQLAPTTQLIVPGVTNVVAENHEHGAGDGLGHEDDFPVLVRALAVDGSEGHAVVRALKPDGSSEEIGSIELAGGGVGELVVSHWPEEAQAVIIEADTPIIGGVMGSAAGVGRQHDYAWFTPAPLLEPSVETAVAMVDGGQLVLTNPGDSEAEVSVRALNPASGATGGAEQIVLVPAGAAIVAPLDVRGAVTVSSSTPIAAGVRVAAAGAIAGYPVASDQASLTDLTVYTR